jgi:SAM-dependent methyltransferase
MERRAWLDERRAAIEAAYDAIAPTYEQDPYPVEVQHRFVGRLLQTCPPGALVLDAPCGTGLYFPLVAAAGHRVVGIDQSAGMLEQARAKAIAVALERVGLQELAFDREFDAVITVDAMENVFPEDWPTVLANLRRALRPGGHLYLTVEETAQASIDEAFAELASRGLPVVRGEVIEGDVAGYHYYPSR